MSIGGPHEVLPSHGYNPRRRHTSIGDLSPVEYERRPAAAAEAA